MGEISAKPDKAFILAAGMGTRMRPLTDHIPKPMVRINGRSLIYHALDKLAAAGVRDVMVNMHYKADVLARHLAEYPQQHLKIHTIYEEQILDTGGGVVNVLSFFEDRPFFVIAGDGFWEDASDTNVFDRLAQNWNDQTMDILTLMEPLDRMILTQGTGDYDLLHDGRVRRAKDKNGAYMWTNIRLNHPRLYKSAPDGAFSFLSLMDACEEAGRYFAFVHDGAWHHISTPADLEAVDKEISGRKGK